MDQNTSRGLAAVRRIKRQHNLEGVYGTLAELLEVNERYRTAVEVTAGNSLFHYVVDNDETATKVLEILQKERAGRVTFMPLNRLKPRPISIPKAGDAVHIMDKIKFEPAYQNAFEQVFGKTIVCPNLAVASQYARSHGVNAITPEGDRSDKKGALTGGFHDPRQSRLEAVKNLTKWRDEYEDQKNRGTEIRIGIEKKDQEITRAVGELQKLDQRRLQTEGGYGPLRQELRNKQASIDRLRDNLDAKSRAREKVEADLKVMNEQLSAYQAELSSEFKKVLTSEEDQQLESLSSSVQDLRRQLSSISASRSDLEAQKSTIEVELRENLRLRLDQLQSQHFEDSSTSIPSTLKESQRSLARISKAVEAVETKLVEVDVQIETLTSQLNDSKNSKTERLRRQEDIARLIERHQKRTEKAMGRRARLAEQLALCNRSIRDLGVLPEDAFSRFEKMKSDAIMKRLHKCREGLKKYGSVNKKAFEQYANFTKQKETLTKRREELDSSQSSIEELIDVLDQRKDEAIERTFKQVSKEFATIFERLVPAGRGRLIIQRKTDAAADVGDAEDSEEEAQRKQSVENYTGVGISVSFNSKHDDQQRIQQLSGGQKSKST
jgi:structural maintenance of chromosome 3 (chondroitin sulfate proteoglycan 6)